MYQVTIIWQNGEIGYGEGESEAYARQEAIESVDAAYAAVRAEWEFSVIKS